MISDDFSAKQVERFAGLDFFPVTLSAIRELRLAMQAAETEAIAELVATAWIAQHPDAPTPAELRTATYAENDRSKPSETSQRVEGWRKDAQGHPVTNKRLASLLDEHRHLLNLRQAEIKNFAIGRRPETEVAVRLREVTEILRHEGSGDWTQCHCGRH